MRYMKLLLSALVITISFFSITNAQKTIVINEFMASNNSNEPDPQGEYDDWIEIYN